MNSPCGYYCKECPHFKDTCEGCRTIKGKPFWIKYYDNKPCPIYSCAEQKNLEHCGLCSQIPCRIWMELKDPSYSEEDHQVMIKKRVQRLKKQL